MSKSDDLDINPTKELVQKITKKIFSKSSIDRDEVRSIIGKILRDYKVEFKRDPRLSRF